MRLKSVTVRIFCNLLYFTVFGIQEFQSIYKQVFPSGDPSKFAGFVFNVFDQDHSGTITFDEFITALSITSRGNLDEKLKCE